MISGVSTPALSPLPPLEGTEVTGVGGALSTSSVAAMEGVGTRSALWVGSVGGAPAMPEGTEALGGAEEEEEVKIGVEATGGVVESGHV